MTKPSTPKGTRDFLPDTMRKRNYLFGVVRTVFEKYGYAPIETPAMEHLETLTGKYGEEGDRLIFKILQRGEKLEKALAQNDGMQLAEEALRYDLTVPFARFVVQHQNELSFPFRRYQIQPVWRADRPQKGRYREFYQCDADVVGTTSLRCEVEYVQMFDEVFHTLGVPVRIRINNRKILSALAALIGEADRMVNLTVAIDKLDKLSLDAVLSDLRGQGFAEKALLTLQDILGNARRSDDSMALLQNLRHTFADSAEGLQGVDELEYVFDKIFGMGGLQSAELTFDLTLARGLNYYTGAIFEVVPRTEIQVGSICGGGRYDDLTGIFGMKGMSGVGISFGADRIYDLLEALDAFPESETRGTDLLFINFGDTEADFCHSLLNEMRTAGIRAELYPDASKLKKQMKYADDKHIPFVALVGQDEVTEKSVTLKYMKSGAQKRVASVELVDYLRNALQ